MLSYSSKLLLILVLLIYLLLPIAKVKASNLLDRSDDLPIAVIISREIKPFIEMVEGFESIVEQPVVRIFLDQNRNPFSHDPLYKDTNIDNYSFIVAVGPLALSYIIQSNNIIDNKISSKNRDIALLNISKKVFYTMVLNPENIIPEGVSICGISLNLFSEDTISKIVEVFPSIERIGILFDPLNNKRWFEKVKNSGVFNNIITVPMHISEHSDLNSLRQQDGLNVDALLFIPDKTVTSPTIINHIIKQSVARKIPVIGYNSFFHKSGAALSFVLDYRLIGEQMAHKILAVSKVEFSEKEVTEEQVFHKQPCEPSTPAYHISLNRSIVELLELELGTELPAELKVEP